MMNMVLGVVAVVLLILYVVRRQARLRSEESDF
jgi:cytochrome c oxidase assembly factor CtaG